MKDSVQGIPNALILENLKFDFLAIRERHDEKELEDALVGQIT